MPTLYWNRGAGHSTPCGDMLETQFGVIAGFTRMRVRWILRFGVFRADSPSSKPFVVVLES